MLSSAISYTSSKEKRNEEQGGGGGLVVGGVSFVANHWECRNLIGRKRNGGAPVWTSHKLRRVWRGGVRWMDGCREVFLSSLHSPALLQCGVCFSGRRGDGKPGGEWGVGCSDAGVQFSTQPRCIGGVEWAGIRSDRRLMSLPS